MTTIYSNTPQTISTFIPELGKNQIVSTQTVDNNKNIIYRSFKVYSFPNNKAKDIRLVQLDSYSSVYKSDSYFAITQEFVVDTYSSTQEVINNVLQPSFYTWEHTTTTLNHQRQLGNAEKLVVTWTPPTANPTPTPTPTPSANITPEQIGELTPEQIEEFLQPFNIQVGDVYGVTIPPNCTVLSPTNLNPNLLINVDVIRIKPHTLAPLSFSFKGVDAVSLELPYKIVTDNPKLLYPKSLQDVPKVPPNITGLNTNFPALEETELTNYVSRRSRSTAII